MEKNPFADKDGKAIKGKEFEFFEWAADQHEKAIETLTPEERKKAIDAQKHMAKKMQS